MKKTLLLCMLFCTIYFFGQNDYLKSGTYLTYTVELTLNSSGQNNPNGIINSLNSLSNVKETQLLNSNKLSVKLAGNELTNPNSLTNSMLGTINQFVNKIVFSDLEEVLNNYKDERVYHKTYTLSGLSNKNDAQEIVTTFLSKSQVLFVNADFETHQVFMIVKNDTNDKDLKQIIKDSGRNIIESNQEISKYY